MRRKAGTEMRRLIFAITVMVVLLVLAIVTYFVIDIIITANNNIEHNKEKLAEESAQSVGDLQENIAGMEGSLEIFQLFNQDVLESAVNAAMQGDLTLLNDFILDVTINLHPVEYVAIIVDGKVADYRSGLDTEIDPTEMPTEPPDGDYETLESVGDREGYYMSAFYPVDLASLLGVGGDIYINSIDDISEDVLEIEAYFKEQRNDTIARLIIAACVAIFFTILVTTFGLRYFTNKYVVKPVEELNRMAEEIADGIFEGEVKVDEKSAYAALQGLLRSGQLIIERMGKDLEQKE
jgi:hypothetical protein